jgi:hypothetical protein
MIEFTLNGVPDKEFMEIYPEDWHQFVAAVLGTSKIELDWKFLEDAEGYDSEEQWEMPEGVTRLIEFENVTLPDLSVGYVALCEYKGIKFLCEQNASPFTFYRKAK